MSIIIRTVGNRSLYRSLYENIDSRTHHRTVSGAIRRVRKIDRDSDVWAKTVGNWGHIEIEINGQKLDQFDADWLAYPPKDQDEEWLFRDRWERAIKAQAS